MQSLSEPTYRPGEQIPGSSYRVLRILGTGGQATVYLCEHLIFNEESLDGSERRNQRFAVKVLHELFSTNPDLVRRMHEEANLLRQLRHRNLVPVLEAGMTADQPSKPYIVMEYLRGEPLSHAFLDSRKGAPRGLPMTRALEIVMEVTAALQAAHEAGVIHRDIKPLNIFVCREGDANVVKLLDFGIAAIAKAKRITRKGEPVGTPRYMSPEMLSGQPLVVQSDLYAVGLVLYELLTGKGPFDDGHAETAPGRSELMSYARDHLARRPPLPSSYRPAIPSELDALVLELLEKEPKNRPASAAVLRQRLQTISTRVHRANRQALSNLNRTEPTPLDNRLIPFSGPTPIQEDVLLPGIHDTPLDAQPMGGQATLDMRPAPPTDEPPDLHDLAPASLDDPADTGVQKTTVRMQVAPHPDPRTEAVTVPDGALSNNAVTVPGNEAGSTLAALRARATIRMSTAPVHPSRSTTPAPNTAPPVTSLPRTTEEVVPPAAQGPASRAAVTDHTAAPPPAAAPKPATHRTSLGDTAAGLTLPTPLRRLARSRIWQLTTALTVVLLVATIVTHRARPFTPAPPPSWLAAEPTLPPIQTTADSSATPTTSAEAAPLPISDGSPTPSAAPSTSGSSSPAISAQPEIRRHHMPATAPTTTHTEPHPLGDFRTWPW